MQNNEFECTNSAIEVNREQALHAHELNHRMATEARKAAIDSANVAIRSLFLLNGGAVVVLLAFISALRSGSNGATTNLNLVTAPILWFAWGAACSVATSLLAYFVNRIDSEILTASRYIWEHPFVLEDTSSKGLKLWSGGLYSLALLLTILSLTMFFLGVYGITGAISQL
jgi:hypothetical protein